MRKNFITSPLLILSLTAALSTTNLAHAFNTSSNDAMRLSKAEKFIKAKEDEAGFRDFTFSPDGKNLYVIVAPDTLFKVDPETGKVNKKLVISHLPDECHLGKIAITPDGKKLYLTTYRKSIYVINAADLSIKDILKTKPSTFTYDMVMTPRSLFVADLRTYGMSARTQVNVIDTQRDEIFYRFSTKNDIMGFAGIGVTSDNRYVYLSDWLTGGCCAPDDQYFPSSLNVYDTYTNTAIAPLIPEITGAAQIIIDSQHNKLYAGADEVSKGMVYVVDLATNKLLKKLPLSKPHDYKFQVLGLAKDQSKLYIVQEHDVAVLNTATDEVEGHIALEQISAIHTGVDPSKIYFGNPMNFTISVVDIKTNAITKTIWIKE